MGREVAERLRTQLEAERKEVERLIMDLTKKKEALGML